MISNRGTEWAIFSAAVLDHVEDYTVPQYGDAPDDEIEDWTSEQVVKTISKRSKRFKRNSREGQDALDLLKIAHEACLAYNKLMREGSDDRTPNPTEEP